MNTKINYLYRDASNYKVINEVIINGTLTAQQINEIIGCLDMENYFIPSQVGLPENKFPDQTEDDHCWFELERSGFKQTADPATVDMTAEELLCAFRRAKDNWDETDDTDDCTDVYTEETTQSKYMPETDTDAPDAEPVYTWAENENQEIWDNGKFCSIKDCTEDAKGCGHIPGDTIYIGICRRPEIGGISLSSVLEHVEEDMYEQVGEASEGWDISSVDSKRRELYDEYEEKLRTLVEEYIDAIDENPYFYTVTNIRPIVIR